MSTQTIQKVSVHRRINKRTQLLKCRIIETGEEFEFPFDDSEFEDGFTHEEVLQSYKEEGIEILDWTSQTYFD